MTTTAKKLPYSPPKHRAVLKVSSINIEFKSVDEKDMIMSGFARFLNSLQHSVQIICDSEVINPEDWKLKVHDEEYYQYLRELVEKRKIVEKNFYLAFALKDDEDLEVITEQMIRQLKNCKLEVEKIDPEEPQIVPYLKPGFIKVGDWYYDTIIIEDWPHMCSPGWLSPLYNMDKNVAISMFVHPVDNQHALFHLQRKMSQVSSTAISKDSEYLGEHDQEILSAMNMQNEIINNEGKFFFMSFYITVKSRTYFGLKKDVKQVKSMLNGMMIKHKKSLLRQDDGFRVSLPHGVDYLGARYNMTTTPLTRFFPFVSSNIIDKNGIMLGVNLLNGGLVFLDHFKYLTASMLVLGKAGSGKSFTIKAQIDKLVKQGVEVTVLDTENEFQGLKEALRDNPNLKVVKFDTDEEYETYLRKYYAEVNESYKTKKNFKPRFLVIDEFWRFMKKASMAALIQELVKVGRKRFLGICVITQEVEDLLASEYARSIINNCSMKIILKQESNQKDSMQKTFGLTKSEWSMIVGADEGEGILFAGSKHVQFKTMVSDKQYKIITTKPQDFVA